MMQSPAQMSAKYLQMLQTYCVSGADVISQVGIILIRFIFSGQFWHPVDFKQLEICN